MLEGREDELRGTLDALPDEELSPLARVRGLHFSRWVIVPDLVYGAPPQRADRLQRPLLIFSSTFDGSLDDHLPALMQGLGETADAVWGHCDGWPGRERAREWLLAHRVKAGLYVAAYEARVEHVRQALAARERLLALAEETQRADDETLRRRFLEELAP